MTEIDIILTFMNHPLTWIIVIAVPTVLILKNWFKSKLEQFKLKVKQKKDTELKLDSVAGKVEFAINNKEVAYKKLSDDIKQYTNDMAKTNDPDARKIFEGKIKSTQQQLKIVQKLTEHSDVVDMFAPIAIPAIEKIEKGILSRIKGGFNI